MALSESTRLDERHAGLPPATRNDESPTANRLWWVVPIGVAAAAIANVIFYFILTRWLGEPLLMIEQFPPPEWFPCPLAK